MRSLQILQRHLRHQAGDQVLVGIAICISDSVRRAGDCNARYGGEEFSVLLPGCGAADALKVAETIRSRSSSGPTARASTPSASGVASLTPAPAMEWSDMVEAADKALYAAKAGGRNPVGAGKAAAAFAGGLNARPASLRAKRSNP